MGLVVVVTSVSFHGLPKFATLCTNSLLVNLNELFKDSESLFWTDIVHLSIFPLRGMQCYLYLNP